MLMSLESTEIPILSFGGCISVVVVAGVELSVDCVVGRYEMGGDGVGGRSEVGGESDDMYVVDICCCVGIS